MTKATKPNDVDQPKERDVGDQSVVHRPDPSVVHVADEAMTYQLAKDWHELLGDADGRDAMIAWLRRNDPVVAGVYSRIEQSGIRGHEADRAVLLVLIKAMRSKVPRGPTNATVIPSRANAKEVSQSKETTNARNARPTQR